MRPCQMREQYTRRKTPRHSWLPSCRQMAGGLHRHNTRAACGLWGGGETGDMQVGRSGGNHHHQAPGRVISLEKKNKDRPSSLGNSTEELPGVQANKYFSAVVRARTCCTYIQVCCRCHYCFVHMSRGKATPRPAVQAKLTRAANPARTQSFQTTLLATIWVRDLQAKFRGAGVWPGRDLRDRGRATVVCPCHRSPPALPRERDKKIAGSVITAGCGRRGGGGGRLGGGFEGPVIVLVRLGIRYPGYARTEPLKLAPCTHTLGKGSWGVGRRG